MKMEEQDLAIAAEEEEASEERGEKEKLREGDLPEEEERRLLDKTWRDRPGFWGWLTSTNHKSIGKRFIITAFIFFLLGGILAILMRIQLARPENTFLGPDIYNQIFTMHGTTMMFLFAIPVMEAFALYLVPLMVGTRMKVSLTRFMIYGTRGRATLSLSRGWRWWLGFTGAASAESGASLCAGARRANGRRGLLVSAGSHYLWRLSRRFTRGARCSFRPT